MSSVIFNLALQQIPGQYPNEAIFASFLIHLEPNVTLQFLQLKGHGEIINHRNKEISYIGTLFCQCNKYRLIGGGGVDISSCIVGTKDSCFSSKM
jgi:hypothetical protein